METFFSSNFLRLSYWFSLSPAPLSMLGQRIFLAIFVLVFLIGVSAKILAARFQTKNKLVARIYRKMSSFGLTMGFLGFLLWFFFFEGVYLLAGRFWFIVWGLILLVWLGKIIYWVRVKLPQREKTLQEREELEKYLPGSRHSR